MPDIHLLTSDGDLRQVTVLCGTRLPEYGTWKPSAVTCPSCRQQGQAFTTHGPASTLSEKAWLQQVRSLARAQGWMTYHPLSSQGSEPGWIDLVCLKPPVLVCAELKTDVGRVTPAQQRWLTGLQQVERVHSALWRPSDWDEALAVLW